MILNDNDYFGKILRRLLLRQIVINRCQAGKNKFSISANGDIYPCDSFVGNEKFRLGNLNTGMIEKNALKSICVNDREECQKCWGRYLCGGDCFHNSYLKNGNVLEPDKMFCKLQKHLIVLALMLIDKLNETIPNTVKELTRFADKQNGGFYLCEAEDTELFMNPKETYDGAIPSGNSVMAYNFVRLYQLTENEKYRELAEKQFGFLSSQASDYPAGHSMFLLTKLIYENPPKHITIILKDNSDLQNVQDNIPFLSNISVVSDSKEYPLINDKTTYYVCKNHVCLPPENIMK